jgi:hypothetical protein
MAAPTAQFFVRSTDLSLTNPPIIALHPESRRVDPTTYGTGMSIYWLTMDAVLHPAPGSGMGLRLVTNWQSFAVAAPALAAQAAVRIQESFSLSEQIESLYQSIVMMEAHGTDISKWPPEARNAKAEIDAKWQYVKDVMARAKASMNGTGGAETGSDKFWPAPPIKK